MHQRTSVPAWGVQLPLLVMAILWLVFVARLFNLQILQVETYSSLADDNRFDRISIPAARGVVYDTNGSQLVRNLASFNVYITPASLPDSVAETEAIYRTLSELTGGPL